VVILLLLTDETTAGCMHGWGDGLDSYKKQGIYAAEK